MREEGRRSNVQVLNVSKKDYVVGRGELFGDAEHVTAAGDRGMAWRPFSREDILSEAVAVFQKDQTRHPPSRRA